MASVEQFRDLGLTRLEGDLLGHLVLDWLYDYAQANPGLIPSIEELAEHANRADDIPMLKAHVDDIQQDLESRGFITLVKVLAGPWAYSLRLTAAGRRQATHARAQRTSPAARKTACRTALLLWLYDQDEASPDSMPVVGNFFQNPLSFFYGYQFEISDVDRAANWLAECDFIRKIAAWGYDALRAQITNKGSDFVEIDNANYGAYQRRHQMGGGNTINFHGNNSGQIGQAVHGNVTQTQNQGVDVEKLIGVLAGVREALPMLKLEPADADELTQTMSELEAKGEAGTLTEAETKPLMKRIAAALGKSTAAMAPFLLDAVEGFFN